MGALKIERGRQRPPLRLLIHGLPGAGKTSLAAQMPGALFLTPEGEQGLGDIDVPQSVFTTWRGLLDSVRELVAAPLGPFRTVVVDTITTAEALAAQAICEAHRCDSLEAVGGGYGKGAAILGEWMAQLLQQLERLRSHHQVNVCLLAHTKAVKISDPLGAEYDRYDLSASKHAGAVLAAWADEILFIHRAPEVGTTGKGARARSTRKVTGSRRVVLTDTPAALTKSRCGLPAELPADWAAIAPLLRWDAHRAPPAAVEPGISAEELVGGLLALLDTAEAGSVQLIADPAERRDLVLDAFDLALPLVITRPGSWRARVLERAQGLAPAVLAERFAAVGLLVGTEAGDDGGGQ
jgi:hypothetical protein